MRLVPNSWGSSKLTEFNRCHRPAGQGGGQFAQKGQCAMGVYPEPEGSAPLPGYLHSDVLMARRAGIETHHSQQPEPVKDMVGEIFDPLMRSQTRRGSTTFRDKLGHTYYLPTGRIWLTTRGGDYDPYNILWDTGGRTPKELKPSDLPAEKKADREDVLSTYRHEVGHNIKGEVANQDRPGKRKGQPGKWKGQESHPARIVAGEKVPGYMANEVAAWQFAVAISPAHRVSAKMVRAGLASHAYAMYHEQRVREEDYFKRHIPSYDANEYIDRRLRNDPTDPALKAKAEAFAERATKVIMRYGRRLRKRGVQMLPPTMPVPGVTNRHNRLQPGPGGVGV